MLIVEVFLSYLPYQIPNLHLQVRYTSLPAVLMHRGDRLAGQIYDLYHLDVLLIHQVPNSLASSTERDDELFATPSTAAPMPNPAHCSPIPILSHFPLATRLGSLNVNSDPTPSHIHT